MPLDLNHNASQEKFAVLSDVQNILLTTNINETGKLQKICDKLLQTFSLDLVWGGLLEANNQLFVKGAAGKGDGHIKGLLLNSAEIPANGPITECINSMVPVHLANGFMDICKQFFSNLPSNIQSLPTQLYPLTMDNRCIGVIGVGTHQPQQPCTRSLLQMVVQHIGFTLGLLRSYMTYNSLQQDLKLASAVFDCALEGIFITDINGNIQAANTSASRITGYPNDELLGQNPRMLKSDYHDVQFYKSLWQLIRKNNRWQGEIWNKRKNGQVYPEWLSISPIKNDQGEVQSYIGIFIDISKQKEAEKRLIHLANHDKLTGLPNRDLFLDRLNIAVLEAKRHQQQIAVLFIDLDHFKYINDTFGHAQGDQVLQKVASRLKTGLRENDSLARMGGDEFTVILQDFDNHYDVEITANRIISTLDQPIFINQQEVYISSSIGISFFPEDGLSADVLMKRADTAMYSAKNNGRKQFHFFQSAMEGYSSQRLETERLLRRALENNEFLLHYQPQFDLSSGKLIGAEALLRWQRSDSSLVPPNKFIPLAEENGMILPIGEWVLKEVCKQAHSWQQGGWHSFRIAANLSARQFSQAGLSSRISNILSDSDLDPKYLELELTETAAMQNVESTLQTLITLKQTGISISIDDFGTGYSSLSYLKQFPIDRLKIDRSFIADIAHDPNDAAIVVATISLANCMGLRVLAEGVETEEQLSFLKMHGCHEAQGFLLGRPVPAEQFNDSYLANN
ncbi:MAG: EAL domain-containing protein [Methylococcaceae bacterium]|nr:EAL domain-containing protein [Methylococcaceae bacterium]